MFRQGNKIKQSKSAYIGSVLLIVSAFLPSLDVLSKWLIPGMNEARDSRGVLMTVNIWLATLYLSPVILIIATYFRPNPKLYFFPLCMFLYAGAVYFSPIIGKEVNYLQLNSWLFFVISVFSALCFMYTLRYVRMLTLVETSESDFHEDVKEKFDMLTAENDRLKNKIRSLENKLDENS